MTTKRIAVLIVAVASLTACGGGGSSQAKVNKQVGQALKNAFTPTACQAAANKAIDVWNAQTQAQRDTWNATHNDSAYDGWAKAHGYKTHCP